ncbi:sigma-70 family RNA polymerase sigma factor [Fusobacterium sp. SYSU M8D902]|uniref:sigma-70 family RNA polymerase sigma factor n=1 Tax=Fusobacterium sp. SYSU M8D902 TaxID=3159562 RepID=UPI0032E45E69
MEKINVLDFERSVIAEYTSDIEFLKFLEKNGKKELNLDYSKLELKELEDEDLDTLGEETVLDYLEEVASITLTNEIEGEDFVVQNLPAVASIAFNYLREGVAYLDVVQEGTMGLIKGIEAYKGEIHGDFDNYKNYWIVREMVLFIESKINDIKNEFKSFFKGKRENFGKTQEEESDKSEVYLTEEDLLPNLEAIDKREKLMEKTMDFFALKNRLSKRQIDVLNYYFGFGVDRRYSTFEIEEKLGLNKGDGEVIFEQALLILSTMEGKMFL